MQLCQVSLEAADVCVFNVFLGFYMKQRFCKWQGKLRLGVVLRKLDKQK